MKPSATLAALFILALLITVYLTTIPRQEIKLKRFYEITKADPLFYDESLDGEALAVELSRIEKLEAKMGGFLEIEHLKLLPEIKIETERFLKDPDFLKAFRLLNLPKEFVRRYKKGVESHRVALEQAAGNKRNQKIIYFGSATTPGIIIDDLKLIIKNAQTLEKEIREHEKCLWKGECKIQDTRYQIQDTEPELQKNITLLPPEILAPERYDTFRGPYVTKNGCFGFEAGGEPKTQLFYIFEREEGGRKILFPKLATENYYSELEKEARPFAEYLVRRGFRYDQERETNDYRCSDLTYWPEILEAARLEKGGGPSPAKLWTLPYIFRTMPALDFLNLRAEILGPPDPLYFLTVANPYSLIYLTFSPAVWQLEERPRFLDKNSYPLPPGIKTYSELRREGINDTELKKAAFPELKLLEEFIKNNVRPSKPRNLNYFRELLPFGFREVVF